MHLHAFAKRDNLLNKIRKNEHEKFDYDVETQNHFAKTKNNNNHYEYIAQTPYSYLLKESKTNRVFVCPTKTGFVNEQ